MKVESVYTTKDDMTDQESSDLRERMARIRDGIPEDVDQIVEQARELADWRNFVKQHPWITLSAAAMVGFMAVPSKVNIIRPDANALAKLAKRDKLVVRHEPKITRQAGIVSPMVNLIGTAILRSVVANAGSKFGEVWADTRPTQRESEPEEV